MDRLTLRIENRSDAAGEMPEDISVTGKGLSIGRKATNDWALPDNTRFISGKHISIEYTGDGYVLEDVSTNGTFVNGSTKRIDGKHKLSDGDTIRVGSYIVAVDLKPAPETALPQIKGAQGVQAPPTGGTMRTPATGIQQRTTTTTSARGAQTPDFSRFQTGLTGAPGVQRPTGGIAGGVSQPPNAAANMAAKAASLIPDDFEDDLMDIIQSTPPQKITAPDREPEQAARPADPAPDPAPQVEAKAPEPQSARLPAPTPEPKAVNPAPAPVSAPVPVSTPAPASESAPVPSVGPFGDPRPAPQSPPEMPRSEPAPVAAPTPASVPDPTPMPMPDSIAASGATEQLTPRPADSDGPFSLADPTAAPIVPRDPPPKAPPVVEKTDVTPQGLGERFAMTMPPKSDPPAPVPAPVPAPAEPVAAAPSAPARNPLLEGFLEGAEVDDPDTLSIDLHELGVMLGKCARLGTREMMQMLLDRSAVKLFVAQEDRTMRIASGNNPMKFMLDPDEAFKALFVTPRDGYQTGPDGFENALTDIRQHQQAMMAAIQPALADMLEGLAPDEIAQDAGGGRLGRGERKSWEEYTKRWESRAAQGENGMLDAFLDAFSRRYNQALESL